MIYIYIYIVQIYYPSMQNTLFEPFGSTLLLLPKFCLCMSSKFVKLGNSLHWVVELATLLETPELR